MPISCKEMSLPAPPLLVLVLALLLSVVSFVCAFCVLSDADSRIVVLGAAAAAAAAPAPPAPVPAPRKLFPSYL